jgi:membrane-bound metal-dependent hydrolase YbcI (DUF457 family)
MFIGHFAVGIAAKRHAPNVSLAWLLAAPQLLDLLWPVFVATGIERASVVPGITAVTPLDLASMPWSHSLVMACVWAAVTGVVYHVRTRDLRGARVLAFCVVSHWVLDWLTHRPDMQLYPGSIRLGLGLWNSIPATITIEGVLFACSVISYTRFTRARTPAGTWHWAIFVALLSLVYLGNIFGPPPPHIYAVIAAAFLGITGIVFWGRTLEKLRENRT